MCYSEAEQRCKIECSVEAKPCVCPSIFHSDFFSRNIYANVGVSRFSYLHITQVENTVLVLLENKKYIRYEVPVS